MSNTTHYVIRGGLEGRERLRVLSRVMHATTMALFDRLEVQSGLNCLDVGCGGGDITLALARRVAPGGMVVGLDIDDEKLRIARLEAEQQGIDNVEFRAGDIRDAEATPVFDFVYARFLLTHLSDPASAIGAFYQHLRPGGAAIVEDVDFSGHFTYPESKAFRRYHELYCATVIRRGGDPNIGPRLPSLLQQSGFAEVGVGLVQPIAMQGEAKLLTPLTMENIVGAVVADGLASQQEIDEVIRELYEFAAAPDTLAGTPRVIQAWGRRARS
jgi:ubiquinone/menaquinone biosynthesis C-methylase UbiE